MLKITLEEVNKLLGDYNGDLSILYPKIEDRLSEYRDEELPFPGEFLFFEEHYLLAIKDMLERDIPVKKVIDIGCQYGFQTEWLKGVEYIGIDTCKHRFFNEDREDVKYVVGTFPNINIDLTDAVVVSSMSLGFYNLIIDEDEEKALTQIADKLSQCSVLYIATTPELNEKLKKRFKKFRRIRCPRIDDHELVRAQIYCFEQL